MQNNMKNINLKQNKGFTRTLSSKMSGFTLLETLIAIFVMTIAFTALLSLMTSSMYSARYANNEITSAYLAQEAIDYIRNDRDTIAFQGGDWSGINGFIPHYGDSINKTYCFDTGGCYFDVTLDRIPTNIQLCGSSCPNLNYEENPSSGGYYKYDITLPKTKFRRTVKMEMNGTDELLVTVTVDWLNGSMPRSLVLKASLLKWQ